MSAIDIYARAISRCVQAVVLVRQNDLLDIREGQGVLVKATEVGGFDDRGVVVICDPRLTGKSYGQRFLEALPAFGRTRSQEKVVNFLRNLSNSGEAP